MLTPDQPGIVLITGYYPSHGGGVELVCADVADGLGDLGKRIRWLAVGDDISGVPPNCETAPLRGTDIVYSRFGIPFPLPAPAALGRLWREVGGAGHVLIAEANFATSVLAYLAAKLQGKPILLAQHIGAPSTVSAAAARLMRFAEALLVRPMLRFADRVVYVSPVVARYFSGVRTKSPPRVIGHGVDTSLFMPATTPAAKIAARAELGLAPPARIACFAGRCTLSKGIEILVEMARQKPDWHFVVAGDGPFDVKSIGLPNLTAFGHVGRGRLAQIYRASDVLVLPSPSESFSLVVREALASGLGVICGEQLLETDPALAAFVVTRPVDLVAVQATAQEFAAALEQCRPSLAGRARDYVVENCSWSRVVADYAAVIDELRPADGGGIRR